jgi:hypothetical protein
VDRHRFDIDAYPDPNFYFGQHIEISGKMLPILYHLFNLLGVDTDPDPAK